MRVIKCIFSSEEPTKPFALWNCELFFLSMSIWTQNFQPPSRPHSGSSPQIRGFSLLYHFSSIRLGLLSTNLSCKRDSDRQFQMSDTRSGWAILARVGRIGQCICSSFNLTNSRWIAKNSLRAYFHFQIYGLCGGRSRGAHQVGICSSFQVVSTRNFLTFLVLK